MFFYFRRCPIRVLSQRAVASATLSLPDCSSVLYGCDVDRSVARKQVGIICVPRPSARSAILAKLRLLRELHGEELTLRPNVLDDAVGDRCPLSSPAWNRGSSVVRHTTTHSRDASLLIRRRLSACSQ